MKLFQEDIMIFQYLTKTFLENHLIFYLSDMIMCNKQAQFPQ